MTIPTILYHTNISLSSTTAGNTSHHKELDKDIIYCEKVVCCWCCPSERAHLMGFFWAVLISFVVVRLSGHPQKESLCSGWMAGREQWDGDGSAGLKECLLSTVQYIIVAWKVMILVLEGSANFFFVKLKASFWISGIDRQRPRLDGALLRIEQVGRLLMAMPIDLMAHKYGHGTTVLKSIRCSWRNLLCCGWWMNRWKWSHCLPMMIKESAQLNNKSTVY